MRVVVIEEVANGYVVRHREGGQPSARAFAEEQALKHALDHVKAYLLAPVDTKTDSPSFGMLPAIQHVAPGALEPKAHESDRLMPTESHIPRTPNDEPTKLMTNAEIQKTLKDYDKPFPD
jgi:hypothetical protein